MCAMCGCNSEAFMGVEMPNQNVYDVAPGMIDPSNGYGQTLDSLNTLGVGGTLDIQSSQTGN